MRKSLFTSSTALNQLKLMCNMLGRPEEASWFRGRRVFRGTCHPKNRLLGRVKKGFQVVRLKSDFEYWVMDFILRVANSNSYNSYHNILQLTGYSFTYKYVVEAHHPISVERAHQKCLGKMRAINTPRKRSFYN